MNKSVQPDLLAILSKPCGPPEPRPKKEHLHSNEDKLANKLSLGGLLDKKFSEEQEVKKWIEARKRRFPSRFNKEKNKVQETSTMSVLEQKLRTKLLILKDESPHERAEKRRQKRLN